MFILFSTLENAATHSGVHYQSAEQDERITKADFVEELR